MTDLIRIVQLSKAGQRTGFPTASILGNLPSQAVREIIATVVLWLFGFE
jgi:hypothetical protein